MSRAQWERARGVGAGGTRDRACRAFKPGKEFGFYAKCTVQAIITFFKKQESNNLINV